jgi:hypothetical protein
MSDPMLDPMSDLKLDQKLDPMSDLKSDPE